MQIKKGFTLAEILIVLMVIGVLATMTIPSLMKGVTEAQYKTAFKKALNTIVNLTTLEKVAGGLPGKGTEGNADILFDSLVSSMTVKGFIADTTAGGTTGTIAKATDISSTTPTGDNRYKNWIITEDNLAYLIQPKQATCYTKLEINAADGTSKTAGSYACFIIHVDINGRTKGPNTDNETRLGSTAKLGDLKDVFRIYVGTDGATAGSQTTTVGGRIAADLK